MNTRRPTPHAPPTPRPWSASSDGRSRHHPFHGPLVALAAARRMARAPAARHHGRRRDRGRHLARLRHYLINAAAFNEFSSAIKGLSGVADVQVSGTEAFFDEGIYPRLAERDGVAVASPVLEFDASLPGQRNALKVIGLDAFRAGFI